MKIRLAGALLSTLMVMTSCETSDDNRVPFVGVELEINAAQWPVYGVFGYGDHRYFIKSERVPAGFPYSVSSCTNFGGILLISGTDDGFSYDAVLAYDLACPVEVPKVSRVVIDPETLEAVCPKCHSRFDVCEGRGRAISGVAREYKYDMCKFRVSQGMLGGYIVHP